VKYFIRATLNDMIGEAAFRVYRYPESDRDVADEPRPSLVVLGLNQPASEDGVPPATGEFVSRILKQHGKGFRKHSNVLIFLAPDQKKVSDVVEAAVRLLARRHIDQDKATKRQLSDKQLTDLANRLKEAEAQLPAAIAQAYRHVLVPADKKTLRCFDMGIAAYDAKTKLSNRVLDLLKGHDQLLDKLDPAQLTGTRWGLWPADQQLVNVKAMADYFTQLTHLPMLTGPAVLSDCIAKGVERGLFAYALGDGEAKKFDTIYFRQVVDAGKCDITESAWLLRPELARSLLPEKTVVVGPGGGTGGETLVKDDEGDGTGTGGGGGGVKIVQGERRLSRVRITMRISWENWNDIYNEVIDPLAQEGADILCDVNILAQGDDAIRENTVELVIREALSQRGIKADIHK
jgi:hypothetical protein